MPVVLGGRDGDLGANWGYLRTGTPPWVCGGATAEVDRCVAEALLVDRSEPDFRFSPSLAWQVASKLGGFAKALGGRRRGAARHCVARRPPGEAHVRCGSAAVRRGGTRTCGAAHGPPAPRGAASGPLGAAARQALLGVPRSRGVHVVFARTRAAGRGAARRVPPTASARARAQK